MLGVGIATQVGQVALTHGLHQETAGRATAIGYLQVALAFAWGVALDSDADARDLVDAARKLFERRFPPHEGKATIEIDAARSRAAARLADGTFEVGGLGGLALRDGARVEVLLASSGGLDLEGLAAR